MAGDSLHEVLHTIGQSILNPCMVVLILMVVVTVWQIGDLLMEIILERRKMKEDIPELLKKINQAEKKGALLLVENSRLLKRQKRFAKQLAGAEDMTENAMAAYAQKLLSVEDSHYRRILMPTDLIAKLGPMLGLLGTLIPLGPGIVALGKGDIATLSESIGVGFDTTIIGVIVAAICFSISYLRNHWYEGYISTNEALAESILDKCIYLPEGEEDEPVKAAELSDKEGMKKNYEKKLYQV